MRVLVAMLLLVAVANPVAAEMIYSLDDPKGDATAGVAGPAEYCYGSADASNNRGCDLLGFTVETDGDNGIITFLVAGTTWICDICHVEYRFWFTDEAGTATGMRVGLKSDGSTFDPNFNTDRRTVVGGVSWAVDTSANTVTGTFPLAKIGATPGSTFTVDSIYTLTGYNDASGLHWTAKTDQIASPPALVFPGGAADEASRVVYEALDAATVEAMFENATSDDYVFNFTTDLPAAVAVFDVNGTGMANATLVDGDGTELFNGTVESASIDLGNVTAGDWQLIVDFTDFNGTFGFDLVSPEVAADAGVATGGADAGTTDAMTDGNVTGNATLDGAENDAEAPGPALPVLGISLLVAAFAGRRRR